MGKKSRYINDGVLLQIAAQVFGGFANRHRLFILYLRSFWCTACLACLPVHSLFAKHNQHFYDTMKSFFSLSVVLCSALLAQADYLPNHYNIQPTKPGASSSGAPVPTEPCVFRPTQTITATADPACATTCATVAQCYADSQSCSFAPFLLLSG